MIPPLVYGWILTNNSLIARTFLVVIVDDPTGLKVGVNRHRTNILESAFF